MLSVYAQTEGSLVFPRVPVLRVEGPLGVTQLIETPVLNALNFPTLVTTNAARHRLAAGWDKELIEFGARRAQGPNGAVTASRYSYVGGFDSSSNVRSGLLFNIPLKGTHAHSFVMAYNSPSELGKLKVGECEDFMALVLSYRDRLFERVISWDEVHTDGMIGSIKDSFLDHTGSVDGPVGEMTPKSEWFFKNEDGKMRMKGVWPQDVHLDRRNMKDSELAAFMSYASSFPNAFLALVDTFDTLKSGVPNFVCVALALHQVGFSSVGVRLDSGDLAYLSSKARDIFVAVSQGFDVTFDKDLKIVASNDINEHVLHALIEQENSIDTFGIGTHLVTCQSQPALGMVYKLAMLNGKPRMKHSEDIQKATLPGRKTAYRLINKAGQPIIDLIQDAASPPPTPHVRILCHHLSDPNRRCGVIPSQVLPLLNLVWNKGFSVGERQDIPEARQRCIASLRNLRSDHLRYMNPTPYKVSITSEYQDNFRKCWSESFPVTTIE
eukprot:GHVN01055392.1.p1 GENE.GHVN01055392.1~~GHVN01055392.1.p1  ORF type:complete len:495 (-),score=56.04 GHVN01055392.1:154-1638(-)